MEKDFGVRGTRFGWSLVMILLVGCGTTDQELERYVVSDSAGIEIVESVMPLWDDASGWEVAASPTLRIGRSQGDPSYLFSRVVGAVRTTEGVIVVGDGMSNEIRFFDESGRFIRSAGRTGEGPGEFEYLRKLKRCGGASVFAFDLNWQTKVFDLNGELVRETRLTEPGIERPPLCAGVFPQRAVRHHRVGSADPAAEDRLLCGDVFRLDPRLGR